MENKTKSNSVFASIGRGIKTAARWVAKMFGYKAENKFARGLWYVFATCATIVALYLTVGIITILADDISRKINSHKENRIENAPTYLHEDWNQYVSPYVVYHNCHPCYIYNTRLGRRTATDIQWICKSPDGDSLACFASAVNNRRGYFNCFTGEVAIPAQYKKAWVFSEDMACVLDNCELHFIDHNGQPAIDKAFPYTERIDAYCFHNGLCQMLGNGNRIGLIDREGNWVVEPEYYEIAYDKNGFWIVEDRDWNYGLLDADGQMLLPIEYDEINIHGNDSCIFVRSLDHLCQVLDFECNIINPCNYESIEKMEYATDEYDEDGNLKSATAQCMRYVTDGWDYGLMDKDGNIVTLPIYSCIIAIGPDRYHCTGPNGSVILDSKGNECGEKP